MEFDLEYGVFLPIEHDAEYDKTRQMSPGGRTFLWVTCARNVWLFVVIIILWFDIRNNLDALYNWLPILYMGD